MMEAQITGGKASLKWKFVTQDVKKKGEWIESDALSIKQIPNCKFHISAYNSTTVDKILVIKVRKSINELVELICINVSSESGCSELYSSKQNRWTIDQTFYYLSTFLNGFSFTVTCYFFCYQSSSNLYNTVKPFLLNRSLSDFTIVIGKEGLPVHKLILGSQSPVFLAMFESDMRESKENKVTIEDVKLDVMKNVLSFLYTESQEALDDSQMALDMWIVAEKYNIEKLKSVCEAKLFKVIMKSNVLEIFEHAVNHELKELRCACLKFIEDNKEEIAVDPHFKNLFFEKPQLMYTLCYHRLMSKKK